MELLYRSYSCISSRATKCFLVTSHVQLRQAVGEHVSIEKCRSMLWWHMIQHFQDRDLLLEGPLNNLRLSMISIPQPKRRRWQSSGKHGGAAADEEDGFRDTFGYAADSANNRFNDHDQQNHV